MAAPFALMIMGMQAAVHALIGAATALAWGRSRRGAIAATILGLDASITEQVLRWLRQGSAPDLNAPVVAGLVAFAAWHLMSLVRRLQPVRPRGEGRFILVMGLVHGLAAIGAGVALFGYSLATLNMTPAQLATSLIRQSAGRGSAIQNAVHSYASRLEALDRMNLDTDLPPSSWIGANTRRDAPRPAGRLRLVGSIATLRQTVRDAQPADVIELLPGHYLLDSMIKIMQPGSDESPIVMRAASLGSVVIDATTTEAFKVYAPHWIFDNLVMRGICLNDTDCDHAFHVVGGAVGTRFRNLRLEDFNAHLKINGEDGNFPDDGRIENVSLVDTKPRRTEVPVTPIDLDAASNWVITGNFIADFAKAGGDQISYGGYAKAAGKGNVFKRNLVVCEWHLRAQPGQRIGLSFGGGGSDPAIRRDLGRSGFEQSGSVMQDNLIIACSDDGIYINRSLGTLLRHNTLIDTAGIDVRFPGSMATIRANLVDGPIRARDWGMVLQDGNVSTGIWKLFRGLHPVRALFADPARLDLQWKKPPPGAVDGGYETDLCHVPRTTDMSPPPGAFGDFSKCLTAQ